MSIRSIACEAAGMQRRAENEVVDLRELVVDACDEIVLDGGHRQRARGRVDRITSSRQRRCGSNKAIKSSQQRCAEPMLTP